MLHVVHYLRATNMSISTDLSFKMRLQLFENFSFSIKQINQLLLLRTILLEFFKLLKILSNWDQNLYVHFLFLFKILLHI